MPPPAHLKPCLVCYRCPDPIAAEAPRRDSRHPLPVWTTAGKGPLALRRVILESKTPEDFRPREPAISEVIWIDIEKFDIDCWVHCADEKMKRPMQVKDQSHPGCKISPECNMMCGSPS